MKKPQIEVYSSALTILHTLKHADEAEFKRHLEEESRPEEQELFEFMASAAIENEAVLRIANEREIDIEDLSYEERMPPPEAFPLLVAVWGIDTLMRKLDEYLETEITSDAFTDILERYSR